FKLFHIRKYRKFSFSRGKGAVPGTGPGILHSGESGCLLARTQKPVSCLGLPLITRFPHRTRGITCALKSTGVAHSQQASLRQDIAPVTLRSRVPLRLEPHSEPGVPVRGEKGDGHDEASKFAPSRGVLSVARGDFPRPDLALDSSSIGGRVRSKKQRSGAGPSESVDTSSSSLDLTAEVENPSRTIDSSDGPSFVDRSGRSRIWRVKYHLPDDVIIRIPGTVDRVSDLEVDEVPVYEGFFESGFRDRVPSLLAKVSEAKVSEALEISPGQLNPPSWRILIALQNLGNLEGLTIRVAEVLYSYAITPPPEWWRTEIPSAPSRRRAPGSGDREEGEKASPYFGWSLDREVCLHVHSGFLHCFVHSCVDLSLGEKTTKQVLELLIERHQVPFVVSKEALERCSIWGNMSVSKGEEALAEYKRALEVMSAKKTAPKKAVLSENDDEVQFIRRNKRQAGTALASSLKKKSKASGSTPRVSPSSSSDPAMGDSLASIQFIQGDFLQAMSQLFHLGERMDDHASLKADLAELTSQLREDKDSVLANEKEIKALKLKVRNQDEAGTLAAAENVSLREQSEQREEEVRDLRCAAETFDAEKTMAMSGAIVVARWEIMREWLNHQTDSWDLEGALERYKMVKTSEAEYRGLLAPSFEGEPVILSKTETEKTPEPTADDPPTDP
ncbi:hypothetical protein HID58_055614, partial [Brassica napus]